MSDYLLIKFLHLVGFAYWLGGDLGVFYSSYFVANEKLSAEVRVTCAKILFALDQVPRMCMTLMLPLGLHLAWKLGVLHFGGTVLALIWLAAAGWLAMVVSLHAMAQSRGKAMLTTFDYWFRLLLAIALIATGAWTYMGETVPYWVAAKLAIYGVLVGCGLLVRRVLKPFGPAFARLAAGKVGDADNRAIRESLGSTRPFVVTIWIGLLASAALGLHLF